MQRLLFVLLITGQLLFLAACNTDTPPDNASAQTGSSATCNPAQPLNLRFGPGLSYDPALRALSPDEDLTPLAFAAQGFPGGQWIEVEVAATGELGWVSAGSAFVTCSVDPASLPPAVNIPPTPAAVATNTPQAVAQVGPPRITNDPPGGTTAEYVLDEVIVDDAFLFRMWIADTRFGEQDGAGIDHVTFTISTQDQSQVIYENREDNAAYCVFQGGTPTCNPWRQENGRFLWPNGIEVQPGAYHATILVYPQDPAFTDEVWNWDFDFWIDQ